jgi:hypothetical protein
VLPLITRFRVTELANPPYPELFARLRGLITLEIDLQQLLALYRAARFVPEGIPSPGGQNSTP